MTEQFTNQPSPLTLASGVGTADVLFVLAGNFAALPTVGTQRLLVDSEIVIMTGRTGSVATVLRAQEGTVAAAHAANALVYASLTAGAIAQLKVDIGGSSSLTGPLTTVVAGTTPTLNQANVQRANVPTDGAASGLIYPLAPNDGDIIYGKTTGVAPVVNQATINPNGKNIESIRSPGTIGSGNVQTGLNVAVSWTHVYEAAGTLWRLR